MISLTLDEVSHVIALATAPAFLIGAVVGFLSLLVGRMSRIIDRMREFEVGSEKPEGLERQQVEMPRLRKRASYLHAAMLTTITSGVLTSTVMVVAFVGAITDFDVEVAIAMMFIASLSFFLFSLWLLAHEAMIALWEFRR